MADIKRPKMTRAEAMRAANQLLKMDDKIKRSKFQKDTIITFDIETGKTKSRW